MRQATRRRRRMPGAPPRCHPPVAFPSPIEAVRVRFAPAAGVNVTLMVQLPEFGLSVVPAQLVAVTRKSAVSPPLAIVTALLVWNTSGAVPALVMVTVWLLLAPTAVAGKIGPLAGA